MRVTSALWVSALVRRYNDTGAAAVVARRGAEEAGAIFIVMERLNGVADLFAPAPQTVFDDARPGDRRFQKVVEGAAPADIEERLQRERRFDPDLWTVAIEDREGRIFFETA